MFSQEKEKTAKIPVFYNIMPDEVPEEIIHSYDAQAVINLTESDGSWAMACIRARRPYAGVCFTEHQVKALLLRLEMLVFRAMQNETDPLYQPTLVELLATHEDGPTDPVKKKGKTEGKKSARAKAEPAGSGTNANELLKKLKELAGQNAVAKKDAAKKGDSQDEEPFSGEEEE